MTAADAAMAEETGVETEEADGMIAAAVGEGIIAQATLLIIHLLILRITRPPITPLRIRPPILLIIRLLTSSFPAP